MRINAEGGMVTAPRALLLNEFNSDEPDSCAVFVLPAAVYVEQGSRLWVEHDALIIEHPSGQRERHRGAWETRLRRSRLL